MHLKKIRRAEVGAKFVWVFRVKNHDFTPKNHFFPIAEGCANIFGVFRVKNHDFTPKNHIFSNFRGCAGPSAAPWIRPCLHDRINSLREKVWVHKTSLASPHFIEVYVPSHESE
jgi:hypothetical protein